MADAVWVAVLAENHGHEHSVAGAFRTKQDAADWVRYGFTDRIEYEADDVSPCEIEGPDSSQWYEISRYEVLGPPPS